jgi:hypothetical protein
MACSNKAATRVFTCSSKTRICILLFLLLRSLLRGQHNIHTYITVVVPCPPRLALRDAAVYVLIYCQQRPPAHGKYMYCAVRCLAKLACLSMVRMTPKTTRPLPTSPVGRMVARNSQTKKMMMAGRRAAGHVSAGRVICGPYLAIGR